MKEPSLTAAASSDQHELDDGQDLTYKKAFTEAVNKKQSSLATEWSCKRDSDSRHAIYAARGLRPNQEYRRWKQVREYFSNDAQLQGMQARSDNQATDGGPSTSIEPGTSTAALYNAGHINLESQVAGQTASEHGTRWLEEDFDRHQLTRGQAYAQACKSYVSSFSGDNC